MEKKLRRFFNKEGKKFAPGVVFEKWTDSIIAGNQLEGARQLRMEVEQSVEETLLRKGPEGYNAIFKDVYQKDQLEFDVENMSVLNEEGKFSLEKMLKAGELDLPADVKKMWEGKLDKFTSFRANLLTILQIARENPHIPGLGRQTNFGGASYMQIQRWMETDRTTMEQEANRMLKGWRDLGARQGELVGRFMQELDMISFREGRFVPAEEQLQMMEEMGLNEDAANHVKNLQMFFEGTVDAMEKALLERIKRVNEDPLKRKELAMTVQADLNQLRRRNFFPSQRFGRFVVAVQANIGGQFEGQSFRKGETILREHYETKKESDERAQELRKQNIGQQHNVYQDKVKEESGYSFKDIPPVVLEVIKDSLNPVEQNLLKEALTRAMPGHGFGKHLLKKKGVAGASKEYMKAYLSYSMSLSQHLSRVNYDDQLATAIQAVENSVQEIIKHGGDATTRRQIKEYMQNHREYVFNPGNEFTEWSSLAFFWYMWLVPKQGVLNVLQIPMVAAPYLTAQYGIRAEVELARAIKEVYNTHYRLHKLEPALKEAVVMGIKENLLDQSFAHEMAGLRQASNLRRLLPGNLLGSQNASRIVSEVNAVGAFIFHTTEITARRITFVAAWRLEYKKNGGDKLQAYMAARDAVDATMFNYSRWNRPSIMRGGKRPFFIFMTYIQHYLYFLGNMPGKWYALAMLFYMAGYQGLPFAENIMDLVDWLLRKHNEVTGNVSTPPVTRLVLRKTLADAMTEMGMEPNKVLIEGMAHGAGRYGFGIPWLGQRMGLPIPDVDLSGSISAGRVIPGTEALNAPDYNTALGQMTEGAAGAGFGIPLSMVKAAYDEHGTVLQRMARYGPKFASNIAKAWEWEREGGAETKSGVRLADFDSDNPLHKAELIAQASGFTPSRISIAQEGRWLERELLEYYSVMRDRLMEDFELALKADDAREAKKDVIDSIKEYNRTVPFKGMHISVDMITQSLKSRIGRKVKENAGIPARMGDIPASRETKKLFPEEDDTILWEGKEK